jgi:DNA gyrase subunit A
VLITHDGYVKRIPVTAFRAQLRGGRGITGMATREEDQIDKLFVSSTHDYLLFFTNLGKVYKVKVFELPEASRTGKGQSIANFLQVGEGENVTAAVKVGAFDKKGFLMMATTHGIVKKVPLEDFANIRRSGIIAIKLHDGDQLNWVRETDGKQEVILGTAKGLMIRFNEKDVRDMGRSAAGVRGIRIAKGDNVVSMDIITKTGDLLAISRGGYGKRMKIEEFGTQNRGGKGHIAIKLRDNDLVASMSVIEPNDELLFVTAKGTMSRQTSKGISTQGRYAKGVRIQRVDDGDYIVDLERVLTKELEEAAVQAAEEKK